MKSDIKYPRFIPRGLRWAPPELTLAREYMQTCFGEDLDEALRVPGWLHYDHAAMLCHLAHLAPDGPIVEIGSFKGKSTLFIARGMKSSNTLTAIDPHISTSIGSKQDRKRLGTQKSATASGTSWETFLETLKRWNIQDRVHVVREYSQHYRPQWSQALAMLWIDGDHSYEAARRDIEDWADLIVRGGFLAFHDTHPGTGGDGTVRRAIVDTGVLSQRGFETFLELRNAWFMRKK